MAEATFTFRVDESLKQEFSSFAKEIDRSGAQLLRDFMRDFVKKQQEAASYDVWFQQQVQIGLDQANAGNLISHEDVEGNSQQNELQHWHDWLLVNHENSLTVDAEQDRERIYDYLDERNPIAAIELDDLIREKLVCLPIIILWGVLDRKKEQGN